jgi:hypothetical protein
MPAMDDSTFSDYHRLLTDAARTGRCPVWIADLSYTDPPEDMERILAELDDRDAGNVLAARCVLVLRRVRAPVPRRLPGPPATPGRP